MDDVPSTPPRAYLAPPEVKCEFIFPNTPMDTFCFPPLESKDDSWLEGRPEIELIVDKQILCKLLTGRAVLDSPKYLPQLREA